MFFNGPGPEKKGFHLHFYGVFLLVSEKHAFSGKSFEVLKFKEALGKNRPEPIWPRAGFGPKRRKPAFLQCFVCFSENQQKQAKPIFKQLE